MPATTSLARIGSARRRHPVALVLAVGLSGTNVACLAQDRLLFSDQRGWTEYAVDAATLTITEQRAFNSEKAQADDAARQIGGQALQAKWARKEAAFKAGNGSFQGTRQVTWRMASPDCSGAIDVWSEPFAPRYQQLTYRLGGEDSTPRTFQAEGSRSIDDQAWSSDSRYLLVVEKTERWSVNPLSVLSGIAGHPVPIATFHLVSLDTRTGVRKTKRIAGSLQYGQAAFIVEPPDCSAR